MFSKSDLKIGTEPLLFVAQEQAIRTNYLKHHIDKTSKNPLCRICGKTGESVQHLVSGREILAQREYKRWYDNVARKVHWDLCKKNGLEHTEKWYENIPEGAVENKEVKIFCDINIQSALGSVTKEFNGWIEKLRINNKVGVMQKTALLRTARMLRKVLEM